MDMLQDDDDDEQEMVAPAVPTQPGGYHPVAAPPPPQQPMLSQRSPPPVIVPSTVQPPITSQNSLPSSEALRGIWDRLMAKDERAVELDRHARQCKDPNCSYPECRDMWKHFRTCTDLQCRSCSTVRVLELKEIDQSGDFKRIAIPWQQYRKSVAAAYQELKDAERARASAGNDDERAQAEKEIAVIKPKVIDLRHSYDKYSLRLNSMWMQQSRPRSLEPGSAASRDAATQSAISISEASSTATIPATLSVSGVSNQPHVPVNAPQPSVSQPPSSALQPAMSLQQQPKHPQPLQSVQHQQQSLPQLLQQQQPPQQNSSATSNVPKVSTSTVSSSLQQSAAQPKKAASGGSSKATAKTSVVNPPSEAAWGKNPTEVQGYRVDYVLGDKISAMITNVDALNEELNATFDAKADDWCADRGAANSREPDWATDNLVTRSDIDVVAQQVLTSHKRLSNTRSHEFLSRTTQELVIDILSLASQVARHRTRTDNGSNKAPRLEITLRDVQFVLQRYPELESLLDARDMDGAL